MTLKWVVNSREQELDAKDQTVISSGEGLEGHWKAERWE